VKFVVPMCITALGIGCTMSPATNSVMGAVPVNQSGIGSALNSTTRQIGGALGVAVLGTILNSTYIAKIDAIQWPVQLPAQAMEAIRGSIQGAHIVAQNVPYPQVSQLIIDQSNQAFTSGSEHALVIASIIMAVSAVLTLFILPSQVREPEEL
jgi:DHA2 family multidrug resistance protein-like MFS transporter